MAESIFVIGVGGTGMRCLESVVHFCAAGCFGGSTVNMLLLDTDLENGNVDRTTKLIERYNAARGDKPAYEGLFGAQINMYKFAPDYTENNDLNGMIVNGLDPNNQALADLLFSEDVQRFDLREGYRAQTHLGSMLMYKSILKEAELQIAHKRNPKTSLVSFLKALDSSAKKCFVMGSVFGGTGASSIPVIPRAFRDALPKATGVENNKLDVEWGAVLMTSYFTFEQPPKRAGNIVPNADNFDMSSQLALEFYRTDESVKKAYRSFYILGSEVLFPLGTRDVKSDVGGAAQRNPSHFVEMFTYTALDHFVRSATNSSADPMYYDRCFNDEGLDFKDLVNDTADKDKLAFNMLTLMALAKTIKNNELSEEEFGGRKIAIPSNVSLGATQMLRKEDGYLPLFWEWIHSIWGTLGDDFRNGGDKCLFGAKAFDPNSKLSDVFQDMFSCKSEYAVYKMYVKGGLLGGSLKLPEPKKGWENLFKNGFGDVFKDDDLVNNIVNSSSAQLVFPRVLREVLKTVYVKNDK